MALATTCPQCKTSFKVVPDQLKLRRGLVRCGVCQHVFSGIDFISQVLPVPAAQKPELPNAKTNKERLFSYAPEDSGDNGDPLNTAFFIPDTVLAPTTQMMTDAFADQQERKLAEFEKPQNIKPPRSIALREDETILHKASPKSSLFTQTEPDEPEAINFFSSDNSRSGFKGFASRNDFLLMALCIVLTAVLGLQLVIGARHFIAANYPSTTPFLETVSEAVGLQVETPRSLDNLTIESFELQAAQTKDVYALSAILKNSATYVVKWPAIELSLTDNAGAVMLKKVLLPNEYLAPMVAALGAKDVAQVVRNGFKASGELPLKLALEVSDLNPSGFSAALFYP
jgi:predicted Zn finger-like uncharacterized protein